MSSFRFPPPPPPPPKASSNDAQNTHNSQRGGRGGRGDRGRERGGPGRGRGSFHNHSRGGHGQGNVHNREGSRGGSQQLHGGRGGWQNHAQNHSHGQSAPHSSHQQPSTYSPASFNASPNQQRAYGIPPPPAMGVDPAAYIQAMTFMATPAGMQSMSAFANHMAGTNVTPAPSQVSPPPGQGACKKRRQERGMQYNAEQKSNAGQNSKPQGTKPPRAKVKAAPAVPGFGFSLPTAPTARPVASKMEDSRNDVKRRKLNLGLTHQEPEDDSEDSGSEEDVDEEALWASNEKLKNGVVFEHDGEIISLQTPAELHAWRTDRRDNFPTQQRIAKKAQEAAQRRESELEFLARVTGKPRKRKDQDDEKWKSRSSTKQQQPDLADLRSKVQDSVKKNSTPDAPVIQLSAQPSIANLGIGYESETESEAKSSILSDSSVLSDSSSGSESDSEADSSDSDAPPTSQTSKVTVAPITAPPPPKPAAPAQKSKNRKQDVCHQWEQTGRCKYGRHCKFPHPSKDDPPKMVSLYDRMVEQELEKADRVALDAIKFLGRNGFLG
ncbi:hypothetical protein CC80DRAFT_190396 [Byssothecium circinans]|uniref:C3H1-type domain-containing protein n=1 Tax=Byssothecium circinans TaxID=147558 RepID=A0A6A5TGK3_9PLEO|nr:hypothetical protein CC80DRAFT_190396 [Byssothecium circinans]